MITDLQTNANTELTRLNDAMELYAQVGRRTSSEIVRRAANDILLGTGRGSKGLYQMSKDKAPEEGEITRDREAAGWLIGASSSRDRAEKKADVIFAGGVTSAAFLIQRGGGDRMYVPRAVYVVRKKFRTYGGGRKMAKSAKLVQGGYKGARAAAKSKGYSLLNRRAFVSLAAVAYREAARYHTAIQWWKPKYRRLLRTRSATVVGHEKILNKKGSELGSLMVNTSERDRSVSSVVISAENFPRKFHDLVPIAIKRTADDRVAYINRKLKL